MNKNLVWVLSSTTVSIAALFCVSCVQSEFSQDRAVSEYENHVSPAENAASDLAATVTQQRSKTMVAKRKVSALGQSHALLGGEKLPILNVHEVEGDVRNNYWQEIARELRVNDLRVVTWDNLYQLKGGASEQQRRIVSRFKATGYRVEENWWDWGSGKENGFEARRGKETIAGMWFRNMLYWGHQISLTPTRKRDDGLMAAVRDVNQQKVKKWLQDGAYPSAVDYTGDSVLELAVMEHSKPIVEQILSARHKRKIPIETTDVTMALRIAAGEDDEPLVEVLLKAGATARQCGMALQNAAYDGARKTATILARKAPLKDIDQALATASFVDWFRGSPIQHSGIVTMLLKHKPSQQGLDLALLAAAQDDNAGIVPKLLDAGANINARDKSGNTALTIATSANNQSTVELLLSRGADPNIQSSRGHR